MQLTIRPGRHAWLLVGALLCATAMCNADTIESGQWKSGSVATNFPRRIYEFEAASNDTVIVRVAEEDALRPEIPDVSIFYDDNGTNRFVASMSNKFAVFDLRLDITNSSTNFMWFNVYCDLPTNLYTYSNTLSYSVSILRMPDAPLSYADLDVGIIHSGEYKLGTINVGADLDAATFIVSNRCTVQICMGQNDVALVPNIQIYDPNGNLVTSDIPPPEYRVEKTVTLTNAGIYTVVVNDYFNSAGQYAVSMIKIPGTLWATDTDLGVIISGETKTGTINVPGDLDAAFFSAVSGDVVRVTMREVDSDVNPIIELYKSDGGLPLGIGIDPFQETAVITNTMVTNGVFTVICKDAEDRKQNIRYTLTMEFLPGSPSLFSMPAVPAGLAATDGTYSNRIDITWNVADGANGYDLWRSYETNESVQICTNLATIIYQDENVVTNVTYYYKAKSRNAYGVSTNFSNTDSGYCGTSLTTAMRRALLVGIDNYSPSYGATPLNTCTNDAYGMHDVFLLGDPSNRWASTNLSVLTDSLATKVIIQNALQALATASGAGDLVVYFHSSHGGQSAGSNPSNTFISTYNADFTDAELAGDLALFRTDTKVIIIIDACYSGGMFKLDGTPEAEWLFVERVMDHYRNIQQARFKSLGLAAPKNLGQNIAFMTASDYDELSWTSDYYSLYAGYLITGCALPAVDTDGNGEYSFLELHTYAAAEAVAVRPTQHAQDYNPTQLQNTIARAVGSNGVVTTHLIYNDFDGDGASDLATFNPSTGHWRIASLKRWMVLAWDNFVWGGPGFKAIDGDYDGDQASDANVYNEQTGEWRIGSLKRGAVIEPSAFFGGPGLTPVSGDYNGDKISDAALYKQPDGYWYIIAASTGTQLVWGTSYTGSGFVPVSGDYDGDRIADLAMFHLKTGYWYIGSLVKGIIIWGEYWGGTGLVPVSGDYDGDGYSDLAVYHPTTGLWSIWSLQRSAVIAYEVKLGGTGYTPVPGDYNGDGYDDLAVYQPATGYWFFRNAIGSYSYSLLTAVGGPDYIPVLPMWQ